MVKKISKKIRESQVTVLQNLGPQGFYKRSVGIGMLKSIKIKYPEVMILDMSDSFLALYRRTGDEECLTVSKLLRKSAHTIYRQLAKRERAPLEPSDKKRFLTICR